MLANDARAIPPLTISKDQLEPRNLALGDLKKIRSRIENGRRVLGGLRKEVSLLMGTEENRAPSLLRWTMAQHEDGCLTVVEIQMCT